MNFGHLLERICVGEIIAAVNFSSCGWEKNLEAEMEKWYNEE